MKRGGPLRRLSPLRRRTRLRPMSAKRQAIAADRRAFVERILRERPICEFPRCLNRSEHVHEKLLRSRGGDILDPLNVRAICGKCHRWIHDHPKAATSLGLMTPSWEK